MSGAAQAYLNSFGIVKPLQNTARSNVGTEALLAIPAANAAMGLSVFNSSLNADTILQQQENEINYYKQRDKQARRERRFGDALQRAQLFSAFGSGGTGGGGAGSGLSGLVSLDPLKWANEALALRGRLREDLERSGGRSRPVGAQILNGMPNT